MKKENFMSKKQQNLQDYLNQFQEQIQIHIHRLTPEKQLNILHHMLNDFLYPLPTKLKCTPTSIPETYRKIILHYIITITSVYEIFAFAQI